MDNCRENGDQKPNLSKKQMTGLKTIQKRTRSDEGDMVVMCTDKSSKLAVTTRENYLQMGHVHTKTDKVITRREMIEREKTLNSHCVMWRKMTGMGDNADQGDRCHDSLTTKSQNHAKMTLLLKDHKEGDKTRRVISGNTSNSLGMGTVALMFIESLASSVIDPYEVSSGEDLLSRIEECNEKWKVRKEYW